MRNPFQSTLASAWDDDFVDLASLNCSASDFLADQIENVRSACLRNAQQGGSLHSCSVLLLGSPGVGKTHLFNRLRLRFDRFAVFVLHRPDIVAEANARHVLANILEALRKPIARSEHRQIDAIAGAALAQAAGARPDYPIAYFRLVRECSNSEIEARVEQAVIQASQTYPELWPEYLARLLHTAFLPEGQDRWAALSWLSGREPSEPQLRRLGEKSGIGDSDVLRALRTLGIAAGYGAPLVLVFDQLENLVEDEGGTGRIRAHAKLVGELRDNVRGMIIVQMALESEWTRRLRPCLVGGERDRVEENLRLLSLPDPIQKLELLRLWCERIPESERLAPFPWPFSQEQIQSWQQTEGMTPRMLMQVCGEAFLQGPVPAPPALPEPMPQEELDERLALLWEKQLEDARSRIDEGLRLGSGIDGELLEGALNRTLTLAGVVVDRQRAVKLIPSLRIRYKDRSVDLLVAQQVNHTALAATLRKAISRTEQGEVLVVREAALALSPSWRVVAQLLGEFLQLPRARYLELDREELTRILALQSLLGAARSQDLSDTRGYPLQYEAVLQWVSAKLTAIESSLLRALSGEKESPPLPSATPLQPSPALEPTSTQVLEILGRLRVASLERLHEEARKSDSTLTRQQVLAALAGRSLRWFGDSLVALREDQP